MRPRISACCQCYTKQDTGAVLYMQHEHVWLGHGSSIVYTRLVTAMSTHDVQLYIIAHPSMITILDLATARAISAVSLTEPESKNDKNDRCASGVVSTCKRTPRGHDR